MQIKKIQLHPVLKRIVLALIAATIITLPLTTNIVEKGTWYRNHEIYEYLFRGAVANQGIQDGVMKMEWSYLTQKTTGDYFFLYYPPLSYNTIGLLTFATKNALQAGKIFVALLNIINIAGIILLVQQLLKFFKKEIASIPIIIGLIYAYLPYRLFNIYERGDFAESLAIGLFPFLLLGIIILAEKKYKAGLVVTTISTAAIISSHTLGMLLVAYTVGIFCLILILILKERWKFLLYATGSAILGLLLTASTWIPIAIRRNIVRTDLMDDKGYYFGMQYFNMGLIDTGIDVLTFNEMFALILSMAIIVTALVTMKKKDIILPLVKKFYLPFLSLFLILYVLTQPNDINILDRLPLIHYIQFPFRFMGLAEIFLSLLVGISLFAAFIMNKKKNIFTILVIIFILLLPAQKNYFQLTEEYDLPKKEHIAKEHLEAGETIGQAILGREEALSTNPTKEALITGMCNKQRTTAGIDEYAPKKNYADAMKMAETKDCSSLIGIYIAPQDREKIESVDITTQTITVTLKKDKEDSITLLQRNNTQWETTSGIREEELGYLVINNITEKTFTLSQRPLRSVLLGKIISGATLLAILTFAVIKLLFVNRHSKKES